MAVSTCCWLRFGRKFEKAVEILLGIFAVRIGDEYIGICLVGIRLRHGQVGLGLLRLSLGLTNAGLGLADFDFERLRINHEQHLVGGDDLVVIDLQFQHFAGHAGSDAGDAAIDEGVIGAYEMGGVDEVNHTDRDQHGSDGDH